MGRSTGLVTLWMALGWLLSLDSYPDLLLGVPLTVLFQLGVRRQPLRALWVRQAPRFRLGWSNVMLALGFALLPAVLAMGSFAKRDWFTGAYAGSAIAGAFAAGYALVQFHRQTWRALVGCLAWAGGLGTAYLLVLAWWEQGRISPDPWPFAPSLIMLFPVCFVLEEVSFQGALDTHVFRDGDRMPLASALYVSGLWGLWHLPLFPEVGLAEVGLVLLAHSLTGVPLALYLRRSGNLAVPAFAHAWIDAVRDCLVAGTSA